MMMAAANCQAVRLCRNVFAEGKGPAADVTNLWKNLCQSLLCPLQHGSKRSSEQTPDECEAEQRVATQSETRYRNSSLLVLKAGF